MRKNDDSGVSPVIGVILMVAITVVLAAVVFVLLNSISHNAARAPLALSIAGGDRQARVDSFSGSADWSVLEISSSSPSQLALLGFPDVNVSPGNWTHLTTSTRAVEAGDIIGGCRDSGQGPVDFIVRQAGQVVTTFQLASPPRC